MSADDPLYTLTDAAALCGVAPITLRKYERDGLFTPRRDSRGSRLFSNDDITKLKKLIAQRLERHGMTGLRRRNILVTSTHSG